MKPSVIVALLLAIALAVATLVVFGVVLVRRLQTLAQAQSGIAAQAALDAMRRERGESMQAILDATLSVASSKLGDQLEAGKYVIDREHQAVVEQVAGVHSELRRVSELVAVMQRERAEHEGRLGERLDNAMVVTTQLAATTTSLREALASPKSRGQWGERMAEDVLRMAGFVEGLNYTKQTLLAGGGLPDYSFKLPKGHMVHMDVKFPIDNYLRWLEATTEPHREQHVKQFRRDVRARVKELADRAYIDPGTTVDYLLLFIPNESVYGFLHEHDPGLIDLALAQKVVLCSPTSLFAVLAVIRQSVDNFLVERRSDEILAAIGGVREQWQKFGESVDKIGRGLQAANRGYDDLVGTRTRQFEKQLDALELVRDHRLAESEQPPQGSAPVPTLALRQVV
ncbi:MAG: DNA recombination protein RmuC [Actinomycetota bacterium]|nr:DNA recombination protein RmuC [Actinomycetota bacterium]